MLKSYLTTAFRFISRNVSYSIINVLGLVIGISFSCMLYIYVRYERSYDAFHTRADRIVRALTIDRLDAGQPHKYGVSPPSLGPEMVRTFPEVEDAVRLHRFTGQIVFDIDGQAFMERNWYMADANFFDVFDYSFLAGDRATALKDRSSVVLTAAAAQRYFGDTDVVGKLLEKSNLGPLKITGVIDGPPANSHLYFDMIVSDVRTDDGWNRYLNTWDIREVYIFSVNYLVLKDGSDLQALQAKMPAFEKTHLGQEADNVDFSLQRLTDAYLHSGDLEDEFETARRGQLSYIYIFTSMGVFLLLIAAVNYINLATSRATMRAREVGVRKVSGAHQGQLVVQYLAESLMITMLAAIISMGVIDVTFPYFNEITGRQLDVRWNSVTDVLLPLGVITLIIGIVSGAYPAFHLARIKPALTLRGRNIQMPSGGSLRHVLVIFQFALSIAIIIATLVVDSQMTFIQRHNLGFEKDRLMVIDINHGNVRRQFQTMKNEFSKVPGVSHVAVSSRVPGEWKNIAEVYAGQQTNASDSLRVFFMGFDDDMLETYKLRLDQGRYFASMSVADSTAVLLNETAVKALRMDDPLGQVIALTSKETTVLATVVGIVKDFNFQSLHEPIRPMVIGAWNNPIQSIDYFTLKFSGDVNAVIEGATAVHEAFDDRTPIEYHFLDQQLDGYYRQEQQAGKVLTTAGALSILVACLGLLGLAAYSIDRRMKEMGIRKVMGASSNQLFILLSTSFARQIALAFVIATPVSWYLMSRWLDGFHYRTSLHAGIFLVAGVIAFVIAFATIGYRVLTATRANPVSALRQE